MVDKVHAAGQCAARDVGHRDYDARGLGMSVDPPSAFLALDSSDQRLWRHFAEFLTKEHFSTSQAGFR